ncbi:peptidase M76 family-domain-containing protein [Kalaharituber pfeilii]|nr:peptidase M76 family-domain-containing protein [Kalaharituber pfeilii]
MASSAADAPPDSLASQTTPPPPAESNPFLASDDSPERVIKGGPEWWRRSFAYMTNLGMTPEQRAQYETDRGLKREQEQCRRCEKWRDWNLSYSPIIRFMNENITKVEPSVKPDPEIIRCLPCDKYQSGGFSPSHGILLCQNRLLSRKHAEDTIAHEMIHMYDHLRFNVDWMDLRHHACSEIRASSLSGECRWTREAFGRGVWDFTRHHQDCVRRRATLSVRGHPKCKDDVHAAKVVNQVFESCFTDTRPFDEIYR